eukprot:g38709.t1
MFHVWEDFSIDLNGEMDQNLTLGKCHLKTLEKYHRCCLRQTNVSILETANSTSIRNQPQWASHVVMMPKLQLPKQIFFGHLKLWTWRFGPACELGPGESALDLDRDGAVHMAANIIGMLTFLMAQPADNQKKFLPSNPPLDPYAFFDNSHQHGILHRLGDPEGIKLILMCLRPSVLSALLHPQNHGQRGTQQCENRIFNHGAYGRQFTAVIGQLDRIQLTVQNRP